MHIAMRTLVTNGALAGDILAINKIVLNIRQLNRREAISLLSDLAPSNSRQVIDCVLLCIGENDGSSEKERESLCKFLVEKLVSMCGKGDRITLKRLVAMTKTPSVDKAGRQACFISMHRIATK